MKTVFSNDMVAHVWASGNQESGRSNNGNFFFNGRTLWSYGSHFPVAYRGEVATFHNADSYSVSTSRHQSEAWHASSHHRRASVPGLGELLDFIRAGVRARTLSEKRAIAGAMAAVIYGCGASPHSRGQSLRNAKKRPNQFRAAAFAEMDCNSAILLFREIGIPQGEAEERAGRALAMARDVVTKAKAESEAEKTRELLDNAKAFAREKNPAEAVTAELDSVLESHTFRTPAYAGSTRPNFRIFQAEPANDNAAEHGRELFRMAKAAKARGWTQVAKKCRAGHKAARAYIDSGKYDTAEARQRRVANWRAMRDGIETAIRDMENGRAVGWNARQSVETAIERLTPKGEEPTGYMRRLHLMGGHSGDTVAKLRAIAARIEAHGAAIRLADRRARVRADIAAIRAFRAAGGKATAEECKAVVRACSSRANITLQFSSPIIGRPGLFAAGGWTGESFEALRDVAEKRQREAEAEEHAAAVQDWRDGLRARLPRGVGAYGGPAMVRAVGVQRDDSGAIVAGTLETSQGASVPLPHAVRAFRFVKACRMAGRTWKRNGQTIRVGHFQVDSIDAAGNFKAGCHSFEWAEISRLADSLGLSELAPAELA